MDRKHLFLLILTILIFGLRLFGTHEAIYDDESNFAYSLTVMDAYGFNHDYYSPVPQNILYKPFIALFGLSTFAFRFLPWLFALATTALVFYFSRRHWGEKVAFWATILMLVSYYATLASLQFDVEGNFVMFFVALFFFSYLEYEKLEEKKLFWQFIGGISLGLAVITKYNSVYIVLILGLYSLIKNKWKIWDTIKLVFNFYLIGFILFLLYLLTAYLISPDTWLQFALGIGRGVRLERYNSGGFSFLASSMYLLWTTPLLIGFFVLNIFKRYKGTLLPMIWIAIPLIFYSTFINYGTMDTYLMNTIPALAILGGISLSQFRFNEKRRRFLLVGTIVSLVFFFLANLLPINYIARMPSLYAQELMNFNLNFLFAYTSASGPTFGISFLTLFIAFSLSFACLGLYLLLAKNKKVAGYFFIGFVAISLGFNLFLVSEYLFHPTSVDVSKVKWEMMDYVYDNDYPMPLYSNDQGIQWYFDNDYWHNYEKTVGFGDNEVGSYPQKAVDSITARGGTMILLHWPPLPAESPAYEVIALCTLDKQFYDKGVLLGEVYTC